MAEVLAKGSSGPAVKKLKTQLRAWFAEHLPQAPLSISANDAFGEGLRRAVIMFQAQVGIGVDGEAGDETQRALRKSLPIGPAKLEQLAFPPGLERGASGPKVTLLQSWLTIRGAPTVTNGPFGPATEGSVKRFQRKVRLPVTGVVDKSTWNALVKPMRLALMPLPPTQPLNRMFAAYAKQHGRQKPVEVGANLGPWVRLYCNQENVFWCAGFATYVLREACNTLGTIPTPVKTTLRCDDIADSAGDRFVKGGTADAVARLRPGSFFLVRSSTSEFRYSHCGIIIQPLSDHMITMEGNSNDNGSANGTEVVSNSRDYNNKDFVVL